MNELIYRLSNVSYSYGAACAVEDFSLSISGGETVAVLGSNGSGKTTLLKMLNGLLFPTDGAIEFSGAPLKEEALTGEFRRCFRERVGYVFPESDVQLFCPTVFDELAFGPLQLQMPDDEVRGRVSSLMEMLGIEALKARPPYTLSTGEKKKVAIASVLSINPDVLLLDEPTDGLDPRSQVWLFEVLQGLRELKKTIIISTHDLSLAEDLTERSVVIDESHHKAADGPTHEILNNRELLLRANMIHEHTHRHGAIVHSHSHGPFSRHDEHDFADKERKRRGD
ncbi:MAG: ABC transporter ATP-binding protein [Deltaproteobacteria bacterium]